MINDENSIQRVKTAVEALKSGGMIVLVDEEDRENEGDIVFAADRVDAAKINFMAKHARGLICLALEPTLIEKLHLPMMEDTSKAKCVRNTAFTVSIEARHGVTTGISAHDRAKTIEVAVSEDVHPDDLVVPGHIFPLRAKSGGVLARAGHTEGSVDLAKLAGLKGAAVICEIMSEDGSMARMPELQKIAAQFELPILTIPELISYRLLQDSLVEITAERSWRDYKAYLFKSKIDGTSHVAFTRGKIEEDKVVDVRVHIQRPVVDVFTQGPDSRMDYAFDLLENSDAAAMVYLMNERDPNQVLRDFDELTGVESASPPPARMDQRSIGIGCQILRRLGVRKMRVHSMSDKPYKGISGFGLEVTEHVNIS